MARRDASNNSMVDITAPVNHYAIQCSHVQLIASTLRPIDPESSDCKDSSFTFRINVDVEPGAAYSQLETHVALLNPQVDETTPGYSLVFILLAVFTPSEPVPIEILADFARMYTLSILWPYAREYTSDQFRRTGLVFDSLPVINPQVVTESILEKGLVDVTLHAPDD